MTAARHGNLDVAARCELALLGIEQPTPMQVAGAVLRAAHAHDMRMVRYGLARAGMTKEE